jgi:hypothetical protein
MPVTIRRKSIVTKGRWWFRVKIGTVMLSPTGLALVQNSIRFRAYKVAGEQVSPAIFRLQRNPEGLMNIRDTELWAFSFSQGLRKWNGTNFKR